METTDPYKELLMLEKGIHINKKMPSWEEIKKSHTEHKRKKLETALRIFENMETVRKSFETLQSEGWIFCEHLGKTISGTLDIAWMFSALPRLVEYHDIDVIKWDLSDIKDLLTDYWKEHSEKEQSGKISRTAYLDDVDVIYLLRYTGQEAPDDMTILGSTSPMTLFCPNLHLIQTPAYDRILEYIGLGSIVVSRKYYFYGICPSNRDLNWIYSLRAAFPGFKNRFPELEDYLSEAIHNKSVKRHYDSFPPERYYIEYFNAGHKIFYNKEIPQVEISRFPLRYYNFSVSNREGIIYYRTSEMCRCVIDEALFKDIPELIKKLTADLIESLKEDDLYYADLLQPDSDFINDIREVIDINAEARHIDINKSDLFQEGQ